MASAFTDGGKQGRMQQQSPEASAAAAEQQDNYTFFKKKNGALLFFCQSDFPQGETLLYKPRPGVGR